jgi:tubulin monoglycylase TTLL3/8
MIEEGRFPIISQEEWLAVSGQKPIELAMFTALAKQLEYKGPAYLSELISTELERIRLYDVQYSLNRENIWIVKPASRSRGRGIKAFSDIDEILEYVVGRDDIQWVAQKYIENPLIVRNRKVQPRLNAVRH